MTLHGKLRWVLAPALMSLLLAGCAIGADTTTTTIQGELSEEVPGGADPADLEVIHGWVETLAAGDVEGAAEYFALPSIAVNSGVLLRIETAEDAELFNRSLPCGAKLVRASPEGELTVATFRLTERPGLGDCGEGAGHLAETAFLIEDGEIVEWRRVPTEPAPPVEGQEA